MFTNYLKVGLRNILRRKGYSIINVVGLGLGLTCCLLIVLFVTHEYSYDRFNENFDTLYRLTQTESENGGKTRRYSTTGIAVGPALAESVPEVVRFTRLHKDSNKPIISNPKHPERAFEEMHVYYADASFLQMFSYPLEVGDSAKALSAPNSVLLTATAARRYFGREDPMGQLLNVTGGISGEFRVDGVLRDIPSNSSVQFDFLLPLAQVLQKSDYADPSHAWTWSNFTTFVQLRRGSDIEAVDRACTRLLSQNVGKGLTKENTVASLNAEPLSAIHLDDTIYRPADSAVSRRSIYFVVLIGLVVLLIAVVNYVNLATARSIDRGREVGIRRVTGAGRLQLVLQFLCESALTNFAAMILAVIASEIVRPFVNQLAGTNLSNQMWTSPTLWVTLVTTFVVVTVLAGMYPAFILSSFKPVTVLKGRTGSTPFRNRTRQGLVVLQFAASVILITGTATIYSQMNYVRNMELGVNLHQVLAIAAPRIIPQNESLSNEVQKLMQRLREIPSVGMMSISSSLPGEGFSVDNSDLRRSNDDRSVGVPYSEVRIDSGFTRLFGLELLAGRGFEGMAVPRVDVNPLPVLVNETTIAALGFNSPRESLGKLLRSKSDQFRIIGVLRDFYWSSAHTKREAAVFLPPSSQDMQPMSVRTITYPETISLRVNSASPAETVAKIKGIYENLFPGNPFNYHFVDERFDEQYKDDERFGVLFGAFSGLAILIASLGLFGLVAFTAEQRTKEIGIRKILGASVAGIVSLLSKDFLKLIVVAMLIAWPVAWIVMNRWLQDFAYRVEMGWWAFALAGGFALVIALLTVSTQAIRAALANPVEALRYE